MDALGDEVQRLVRRAHGGGVRFRAQNGDARLDVRRLYIHHQPAGEPRLDAVFKQRKRAHRAVGRQHNLAVRHVQRVECVEKPFLRLLFAYQKLHVVQQKRVRVAVSRPEIVRRALPNRPYVGVREFLRRGVNHRHAALDDAVSDGVHQVGFAHAHA